MPSNRDRVLAALRAIGYEPETLAWEPVRGGAIMEGPEGGWVADGLQVGTSTADAVAFLSESPRHMELAGWGSDGLDGYERFQAGAGSPATTGGTTDAE
jgi:hypothetical protein